MKLSPWLQLTGEYERHCCVRIIEGGDTSNVAHRFALIEKSPRVRVGEWSGDRLTDSKNWKYGQKGTDGFDEDSRAWADEELIKMGYELG